VRGHGYRLVPAVTPLESTAGPPSTRRHAGFRAGIAALLALALVAVLFTLRLTAIRYGALWYPVMADSRRLPGFVSLMREVRLAPYWRRYGWPDHCQPVDETDFRCF